MTSIRSAEGIAHSNIALVKYWGKREGADPALNLPAVGSLSLTLDELRSVTRVEASAGERDEFTLDGAAQQGTPARKVFEHLDLMWRAAGQTSPRPACTVTSINHLPTAAGLASSASGFAALTVAAAGAFGITDTLTGASDELLERLAVLARQGSGSAARSIWGGFVRIDAGERADGGDFRVRQLFGPRHWDVRLLVVHTARGAKAIGSTGGMESSRLTSPYYPAWVATSVADLDAAETALREHDFSRLGEVMEHSCFKMHACMLATRPPLMYWNGTTLEVIRAVWTLRSSSRVSGGLVGWVTSDAGPHVKVLCLAADADRLAAALREVPGVHEVQAVAPGPDASLSLGGREI